MALASSDSLLKFICTAVLTCFQKNLQNTIYAAFKRASYFCLSFIINVLYHPIRYHKLDPEGTVQENLKYKSLIEFPTIFVVLMEYAGDYETQVHGEPHSVA